MWLVYLTLLLSALSLNYGGLICFLTPLPLSFVLVRCLREANVAIFRGRFSWSRQTSLSTTSFPGFSPTRPTEPSMGQVGENPGNEVALSNGFF